MHRENVRAVGDDRDGAQILGGVALVAGGAVVDRERGGRGEQGIAIGCAARDHPGAEVSACARTVFDDHGLAQPLAQLGRREARNRIGDTAGGERDDEGDLPRRVPLGPRDARERRKGSRCGEMQKTTTVHGSPLPSAGRIKAGDGFPQTKRGDCFIVCRRMKHVDGATKSLSPADEKGTKAMSDTWLATEYGKESP